MTGKSSDPMQWHECLVGCLILSGCALPPQAHDQPKRVSLAGSVESDSPKPTPLAWNRNTRSPNTDALPHASVELLAQCGEWDERLGTVAGWLAKRGAVGGYGNDIDQLTFALRAAGTPYVWPAAWSRTWVGADGDAELAQAFSRWLTTVEQRQLRRCGIARLDQPTQSVFVAVVSMALADLELPLPTQARVGQWLDFRARLRVEASDAKVVLLPPTGEPMTVPTQQHGSLVRARFAAASPGQWLVQLLASGKTGPRPMLEAMLFVDTTPTSTFHDQPVPGEEAGRNEDTADGALARIVTAMRHETGRPALRRDPTLDRLAFEHASAMRRSRRIGHDVGDGTTQLRLVSANFRARLAGENVAHAADASRAHRALWASPSHRSNLLHRGFSRWGLGVTRDEDGSLWVCELFASEN